jgi:hypothetical protein
MSMKRESFMLQGGVRWWMRDGQVDVRMGKGKFEVLILEQNRAERHLSIRISPRDNGYFGRIRSPRRAVEK